MASDQNVNFRDFSMVRRLSSEEIPAVCERVMREYIDAVPEWGGPLDPGYAGRAFSSGNCQVFGWFAKNGDGVAHGMLVGVITRNLVTGIKTGYEYLWMVQRKFANHGTAAKELMNAFETECRAQECKAMVFGLSPFNAAAMRRLYRRKGFRLHTESYLQELK